MNRAVANCIWPRPGETTREKKCAGDEWAEWRRAAQPLIAGAQSITGSGLESLPFIGIGAGSGYPRRGSGRGQVGYPTKASQPFNARNEGREAETCGERGRGEEIVDDPDGPGIGRSAESQKVGRGLCGLASVS